MLLLRNIDAEVKSLHEREDLFAFFCKDLEHAKDFSAADMKAVLDTAHLGAVHEILQNDPVAGKRCEGVIGKQHIIDAFRRTRPSLLPADKFKFKKFFKSFVADDLRNGGKEWNTTSIVPEDLLRDEECSGINLKTSLR